MENKDWKSNNRACAAIAEGERQLAPQGRLFVRASGTEPVIRVMAEHPNEELLAQVVDAVVRVIAEEQKGSYAG